MDDANRKAKAQAILAELDRKWSDRLRFAVQSSDGRYSTAWQVWERAGSVYFTGRSLGGTLKVSLHPRVYRLAFVDTFHNRMMDQGRAPADRCIVRWPPPNVENGKAIVTVASIFFPTEFLKSGRPPSSTSKPYLMLEAARSGWAVEVAFFLTAVDPARTEQALLARSFAPILRWDLSEGKHITMAFREREFDVAKLLPSARAVGRSMLGNADVIAPGESRSGLTAMLWNDPSENRPLMITEIGGVTVNRDAA